MVNFVSITVKDKQLNTSVISVLSQMFSDIWKDNEAKHKALDDRSQRLLAIKFARCMYDVDTHRIGNWLQEHNLTKLIICDSGGSKDAIGIIAGSVVGRIYSLDTIYVLPGYRGMAAFYTTWLTTIRELKVRGTTKIVFKNPYNEFMSDDMKRVEDYLTKLGFVQGSAGDYTYEIMDKEGV